jgi:hypothetical protein
MSLDVILLEKGEVAKIEPHFEGGTVCDHTLTSEGELCFGNDKAELNITFNYCRFYYKWLDKEKGIYWLDGKKAKETIERLETAVVLLGTERDDDYWKPTPGNAGYALSILLEWAKKHPDAVWDVI